MSRQPPALARRILLLPLAAALLALLWLAVPPAASRDWARMPWHLADIWWEFPEEAGPFYMLSLDVDIAGEEIGERPLFIAVIGAGEVAGAPLYAGIQSGGGLQNGGRGHIGIFSRWNERDRGAIREAPGGFAASAGSEGDFISVRHPVPWHQGRYRVVLTAELPQGGDPRPWVRAEVLELASGTRWPIGALRFPGGAQPRLGKSLASFVEAFGPPIAPESLPHVTLTFGNLRINDQPVPATGGTILYRDNVPPFAEVRTGGPGSFIVEIGRAHDHSGLPVNSRGQFYQRLRW